MTSRKDPPASGKTQEQAAREKRLAEALRQNLRRRKAAAEAAPEPPAERKPPLK